MSDLSITKRSNRTVIKFIRWYKESHPCVECGKKYPYYMMQFDHVTDDKAMNINRLMWRGSLSDVIKEMQKCELVCANDHAQRTWLRQLVGLEVDPDAPTESDIQGADAP